MIIPIFDFFNKCLKPLKLNGFREEILVTVYRSHVLSHIGYGRPIFISATAAIHDEMERAQSRAFNIIGISEEAEREKYSIGTVKQFIEHTCVNIIKRMLTNSDHKLAFDPGNKRGFSIQSSGCPP